PRSRLWWPPARCRWRQAPPMSSTRATPITGWSAIRAAGAFFLTRRKRNAHCREIRYQPAEGEDILADRRLKIGHRRPRGGAPPNPLWDVGLREIVVARSGREPLYLLTNDVERPAAEIARLYKQRWEIE